MKKHYVDGKAGKANRRLLCPNAESIGWVPRDIDGHQESPPLSVVNMKTDPDEYEPGTGSDGLVGGRGENFTPNANQFRPSVQLSARLSTINEDDKKVSRIITITLTGAYLYDASAKNDVPRCDSTEKVFVVGTISGNAKLDILPLHEAISRSSYSATSSTSLDRGVELYLDILGKRTSRPYDTTTVHRPDWMTPLPLSIVVVHHCRESGKMNDQDDMDGSTWEQMTCMPMNVDDDENEDQKVVMRIRLRSMDDTKIRDYCYHGVFPTETYALRMIPPFAPHCTNDAREACVTILESWREAMDKIIDDDKCDKTILICGAKGSGKSTFLRYATNRLLSVPSTSSRHSRVAILDLDCGQPELGVPGTMSLRILSSPLLIDPPGHIFCGGSRSRLRPRSQMPDGGLNVASYFFGDVTSKADPDTYVEIASRLMQQYREIQSSPAGSKGCLPLLANMDGWVKGLGYELLSAIVGIVNPGHLVQIVGNTKAKSFDMSAHVEDDHGSRLINPLKVDHCRNAPRRIHVIQSFDGCSLHVSENDYRHTGQLLASTSNHRAHRQCTYFLGGYNKIRRLSRHCDVFPVDSVLFHRERGLHDLNSNIGLVLASLSPYAVPFGSVRVYPPPGLLDGTSDPGSLWGVRGDLAAGNMHGSLNGSVVGLCQEPEKFDAHHLPVHACVGLGIIRSIDQARKIFFMLTPVCPSLLAGVTSLVCGNVHLPRECVYRGIHTESLMYMACGQSIMRVTSGSDAM